MLPKEFVISDDLDRTIVDACEEPARYDDIRNAVAEAGWDPFVAGEENTKGHFTALIGRGIIEAYGCVEPALSREANQKLGGTLYVQSDRYRAALRADDLEWKAKVFDQAFASSWWI